MASAAFVPLVATPMSGPFTKEELHLPAFDRRTPLRLVLYPITAVAFWLFLLPAVALFHIGHRLCSSALSAHRCLSWRTGGPLTAPSQSQSQSTSSAPPLSPPPLPRTRPLYPSDAVWLHSSPCNENVITAVLVLSAPLPLSLLVRRVEEQIVPVPGMERLRYLVDEQRMRWVRDDAFDVRDHVVVWPRWRQGSSEVGQWNEHTDGADAGQWSEEGCSRVLLEVVSSVINTPVQGRNGEPGLWSFALLPGYADGCVVVFRAHHVLADGVQLSGVLLEMLMDSPAQQPEPPAAPPLPPALPPAEVPSAVSSAPLLSSSALSPSPAPPPVKSWPTRSLFLVRLRHWLLFCLSLSLTLLLGPLHLLTLSLHSDDFNPLHTAAGRVSPHKTVGWTLHPVSLQRVKRIGRYFGCSVNDVMMAVVVAALQKVVHSRGMTPAKASRWQQRVMHFLVPINIRPLVTSPSSPLSLGNLFAVLLLPFPLYAPSPRARLLRMTRQMTAVKRSVQPLMMFLALYLTVTLLPPTLSRGLVDLYNDMSTAIITNNRSPAQRLSLCGRPLRSWVSWAPCRGGVGLSVTVMSYAGEMRVSVVVDREVGVRGEELIARYEEEFARLEDAVPLSFMGGGRDDGAEK